VVFVCADYGKKAIPHLKDEPPALDDVTLREKTPKAYSPCLKKQGYRLFLFSKKPSQNYSVCVNAENLEITISFFFICGL